MYDLYYWIYRIFYLILLKIVRFEFDHTGDNIIL
jgi:hypothetical protein